MKFCLAALAIAAVSVSAAAVSDCVKYTAKQGDTCLSVASEKNVSSQQWYKWSSAGNDSPLVNCPTLIPGETYCIKPENKLRKRNWFYKTNKLSGPKLALAKKKIASANAKKAASTTTKKATTTTKKATTTTAAATAKTQSRPGDNWSSTPANAPSNAVRHIVSTCTKYATVTSNDSWCGDFSEKNKITMASLYSWNAGLHSSGKNECDNLDDGKAYCVAA